MSGPSRNNCKRGGSYRFNQEGESLRKRKERVRINLPSRGARAASASSETGKKPGRLAKAKGEKIPPRSCGWRKTTQQLDDPKAKRLIRWPLY